MLPDPNKPYRLYTDSSEVGIDAALTQLDNHGFERPICFLSRKLQEPEYKYPSVEKELLAVIYAFTKFR